MVVPRPSGETKILRYFESGFHSHTYETIKVIKKVRIIDCYLDKKLVEFKPPNMITLAGWLN